jgi:hypothetical protein
MNAAIKNGVLEWFRYPAASGSPDAILLLAGTAVYPLVEAGKALMDDIVGPAETTDIRPQLKCDSSMDGLQVGKHG